MSLGRRKRNVTKVYISYIMAPVMEPTGKPVRRSRAARGFKYYSSSFKTDAQIERDLYQTLYMQSEEAPQNSSFKPRCSCHRFASSEQGYGLCMTLHNTFLSVLRRKLDSPAEAEMILAKILVPRLQGEVFAKKLQDGCEQRMRDDLDTGKANGFVEYIQQLEKEIFPVLDLTPQTGGLLDVDIDCYMRHLCLSKTF
ncbi:hypothetical protein BT96DRAFT_940065 [Gymnopus androsaceus JB14]|uniref:Uncharacterized protein n=1 Tax=Gymnopus androsaceus JB14 TaxID=1447944 RepID=A0A6A4HP19_9AGAR|nr:hypothetical protein BT96DRAFT_940065 [Gymnopus androsaceus JB14]